MTAKSRSGDAGFHSLLLCREFKVEKLEKDESAPLIRSDGSILLDCVTLLIF